MVQFNTLRLLKCIGAFKGHFFVKAILKRIQISKQIMIIDIEQGVEIFIPKDLQ